MIETLTIRQLVKALNLSVLAGEDYLDREITRAVVSRPGVEIYADYFDFYEKDRLQIIGSKEYQLFHMLSEQDQCTRLDHLFKENPPAFIFTKHVEKVPALFCQYATQYQIPILRSTQPTTLAIGSLSNFLSEALADHQSIHGVMMDIKGVGVLIEGKSFVGKSESALELLMRGHTLVSDDRVEVVQTEVGSVFGLSPEMTERLMEVRGLGLIDVVDLFGVRAYRKKKKIMLIVELVKWDQSHNYNRLGLEEETEKIFDTDIPKVTIPVQPGRNIASLIEVAAMNWRLKSFGRDVAKEFVEKLNKMVKGEHS
ncbi:MAG: HPr(Ser) kinase/phosphatase [Bacilli bacterium]